MATRIAALFLAVLWISASLLHAEDKQILAKLYSKEGVVEVQVYPEKGWREASVGTAFSFQDAVRVGKHGRAAIMFVDGTLVRMSNNASIVFDQMVGARPEQTSLRLGFGQLHLLSREERDHPQVVTPVITAAIHGTEFVIGTDATATTVAVIQGAVEATNAWGVALARGNEKIDAVRGRAPVKGVLLDPAGAVQWALHYPAVLNFDDFGEFTPGASSEQLRGWEALRRGNAEQARRSFDGKSWRDAMGTSLAAAAEGDPARALEILESYKGSALPATYLLYKSSLHLAFGEVPQAEAALQEAEQQIAKAPAAERERLRAALDAQRAVVALTRNQRSEAETLSSRALAADAKSASAQLARSYVEQGGFNLEAARERVRALAAENPQSAELQLRLAELELGFNDLARAESHTAQALQLAPNSSQAHAMAGFVHLFKNENAEAAAAFEKALVLDSANPEAHLGRGLVYVHRGDLEAGRVEIEKAAALAPGRSLYRSYLGKAFFEQDKDDRAAAEYELAIKLDPEDPTPYLYRAYNQVEQNKVVGALQDVESAIARNNDRAVYRSRLLLDRDEGAASADLAQVFNELGFAQAARIEAIKSINADYQNYSAHRLLSQSYESILLGRANLSEQQISNVFAPLSFNAIDHTRSDVSLNDYTSLFDMINHRTGINVIGDTRHDNYLGEIFKAGREEQFGWLMQASANAQDGSKEHNYLRDNRVRLAGQYQPTYDNRLTVDGDLLYRSERFYGMEDIPYEEKFHGGDVNLSYYHQIDPGSALISQVSYFKDWDRYSNFDQRQAQVIANSEFAGTQEIDDLMTLQDHVHDDVDQVQGGVQHVFDSRWVSLISGYEHLYSDVHRWENSDILYDDPAGLFNNQHAQLQTSADYGLNSDTVYSYAVGHLAKWVDLTVGLSFAALDYEKTDVPTFIDDTFRSNEWNPKVGLTFYPLPDLTVRSAYFRSAAVGANENLRRLEPTLVGGINQLYTDLPGTTGNNYGVGADYKWPGSSYIGAEWVHRDLDTRTAWGDLSFDYEYVGRQGLTQEISVTDITEGRKQDFLSGYFYQVFSKELVGTVDYLYAREKLSVDFDQKIARHTAQAALRYFHPSRFFGFTRGTWRHQNELYSDVDGGEVGNDLWTLDLGVGYRFANRHGAIQLELLNVTNQDVGFDQSLGFEEIIPNGIGGRLVASVNF